MAGGEVGWDELSQLDVDRAIVQIHEGEIELLCERPHEVARLDQSLFEKDLAESLTCRSLDLQRLPDLVIADELECDKDVSEPATRSYLDLSHVVLIGLRLPVLSHRASSARQDRRPPGGIAQLGLGAADSPRVETPPEADWRALDDDGRAFLSEALSAIDDPASGRLAELLDAAVAAGASDLHLTAGLVPYLRVRGVLRPLAGATALSATELHQLLEAALSAEQRSTLSATGDLDIGLTLGQADGQGRRFRVNVFRQTGTLAAAIRIVPSHIPEMGELGLPATIQRFVELDGGLVLVTGPTGSGKSTTLAAMTEQINRTRADHIVTIEDPIEYRYSSAASIVQQREVGIDTCSFATALRHALRQDPDVILIGELRDLETIRIALTAAETGHVVFATLHSADVTSSVNRVIDVFPADQQAQIRSQLALSIQGCVSQRLLPGADDTLAVATEVMVATSAVRNLIRDDKLHQLRSVLETGGEHGMHTFDQSLSELVRRNQLDPSVARRAAHSVSNLEARDRP